MSVTLTFDLDDPADRQQVRAVLAALDDPPASPPALQPSHQPAVLPRLRVPLPVELDPCACPDCGIVWSTIEDMDRHRAEKHGATPANEAGSAPVAPQESRSRRSSDGCAVCGRERTTGNTGVWGRGLKKVCRACEAAAAAERHQAKQEKLRAEGAALTCPDCGDLFKTASGLGGHRRRVHGVEGTWRNAPRVGDRFECRVCRQEHDTAADAKACGTSHGEIVDCPDCGKSVALRGLGPHLRACRNSRQKPASSLNVPQRPEPEPTTEPERVKPVFPTVGPISKVPFDPEAARGRAADAVSSLVHASLDAAGAGR